MSKSQARILSSINTDIAQVFFAAFIGTIILPVDSGKVFVVILELGFAIVFWVLSVLFAERGKL